MLRLFVDDYRLQPFGWHLAKTITEAIRILSGPMYAEAVSLDHDIIYREGKHSFSEENFSTVARYIALMPKDRLPKIVYIHTANPKGARDIEEILKDIVPTEIVEGSFDLGRTDYTEQLIKLEEERTKEHDGSKPQCGCDCKGCLGLIPGTEMFKINNAEEFKGEFQ